MSFYCSECQMSVDSMAYHNAMYHDPGLAYDAPTPEEMVKVRRYECSMRGHSWDAIMLFGNEDPVRFVCGNCGRSLEVVPNDQPSSVSRRSSDT